jgi:multimeric flavodoxin WrbA
MKIIAFLGSPRKEGNTELLLRETIRGVEDSGFKVQVFDLNSMNIQPCHDCGGTNEKRYCKTHGNRN